MKLTRSLLALSAIAALSFGFTACGDDDSTEEPQDKACTSADNSCTGNVAHFCKDGQMQTETCTGTCSAGVCQNSPTGDTCTGDAAVCDGNTLKVCNGSTFVVTECATGTTCDASKKECTPGTIGSTCKNDEDKCPATYANTCLGNKIYSTCVNGCLEVAKCADGMVCDKQTGACKPECDSSFVKTCNDAGSTKACGSNGAFVIESCGAGMKCDAGACVEDTNSAVNADSLVGKTCSGTGKITISNAELKGAMSSTVTGLFPLLKIDLPDGDQITAPNYFENITGCEDLVAPAGMSVGCFFTDTIQFPQSIVGLTDQVTDILNSPFVAGLLGNLDTSEIDLTTILASIKDLLGKGIEFKADGGYCMVADIDIDIAFPSNSIVSTFIDSKKLMTLVNKINTPTHNHEQAKMATCPDGSTLISFSADSESEVGSANVGFDMCMKTCASDSDCRTADGYKCLAMPRNAAEIETGETGYTAKVCFPEANITYFQAMTEQFEGLIPED